MCVGVCVCRGTHITVPEKSWLFITNGFQPLLLHSKALCVVCVCVHCLHVCVRVCVCMCV